MSNQIQITSGAKVRALDGVITGTTGVLSSVPLGGANGVATLDSSGKVPLAQLPASVFEYKGTWNATTNTPYLVNGVGTSGWVYVVSVGGLHDFGAGSILFLVGDQVLYDGSIWERSSGATGTVTSVALTAPSAFNVSGSPITTSGTLAITGAGTTSQYINGAGSLTTFPSLTGFVPYTGATNDLNLATHNLFANNLFDGFTNVAASGTQIVLTIASTPSYTITGSGGQTIKLPDATTLPNGAIFSFNNNQSSGAITINNNSNTLVVSVPSGGFAEVVLLDNSIAAGSWDRHFKAPSNVSWSTNTLDYAGSITSATWNGNVVAINRGGTGSSTQNFVDLTTTQTIGGAKTFSSSLTASSLIKTGGTSSQFLKADGSVDSNTYLTTSAASSTYVPYTGASANVDLGNFNFDANQISGASITAKLNGLASSPFVLMTGSSGYTFGYDAISLNSSPTTANTLIITSNIGAVTKTGQIGLGLLSATRTYTLPDATGTIALLESTQTFSGVNTFTQNLKLDGNGSNAGTLLLKSNTVMPVAIGYSSINSNANIINLITYVSATKNAALDLSGLSDNITRTFTFPNTSGTIALTSNLSSYVPTSRQLTINGTAYDLSADRTWSVGTVTSIGLSSATSGVTIGSTPVTTSGTITIAIATATTSQNGLISSTDWTTFNNKQSALTNPVTGTGTTNYLPKFTGTSTIGNSLVYDNGTNVGIGTTSIPSDHILQVHNPAAFARMALTNTSTGVASGDGLIFQMEGTTAIIKNQEADALKLGANGSEIQLVLTSGGNVLIGTTTDDTINKLQVNGSIIATSTIAAVVPSNVDMGVFNNTGATYTKSCIVASMTATGGTGSYFFYGQQSTSTVALKIFSNGNIQNTNNSYGAISDARLKENIIDATPKLADLMKVKVRNYNIIGESNKQLGVISQELEAIFPNMIEESTNMGESMKIKGVKYSVFVPMLIKAIQEQQEQITSLQDRLNKLENK